MHLNFDSFNISMKSLHIISLHAIRLLKPRFLGVVLTALFCVIHANVFSQSSFVTNNRQTIETEQLLDLIKRIPTKGIAFGHQDATAYGVNWKDEDRLISFLSVKSDVKKVTGSYPSVIGFDLGHLELDKKENLDTVSFILIKDHVQRMYRKGAIITMSWHPNNPASDGSSWDTSHAVTHILEGGKYHSTYIQWIDKLSVFFKSLKDTHNKAIPVIFRPYHEMNGGWFWWGAASCTPEEYRKLWKLTCKLLQKNGVNNLLFAFSPNTLANPQEFDLYYPGDEFVDIIGVDIYNHNGDSTFMVDLNNNLAILKKKAAEIDKPFVLSETGNISRSNKKDWWTQSLYPAIKNSGIAWVLVWRNANYKHFFASYEGDSAKNDFKNFVQSDDILLLDQLKKI
ncbi:mannan endo-1,4-beta-mannosidase [Marivirga lumbricoides]|uniref:Mannan endo-1,4-beta-mannosidase n=2 Tax=Marivirga lumbricoides TaxID=1046115 RepID=A0ABQ1M1K4_9BACT|nr:mannan endo-1,4-beta-mannosidase [Marivirga lumbricoides]